MSLLLLWLVKAATWIKLAAQMYELYAHMFVFHFSSKGYSTCICIIAVKDAYRDTYKEYSLQLV